MFAFIKHCIGAMFTGGRLYWGTLAALGAAILVGSGAYFRQWNEGLRVTGLHDHITWGVYIANFTFLVGVAAAAVMLVLPAYVFHHKAAKQLVLIAEGLAVAACIMALLFVWVDLGRPERALMLVAALFEGNTLGSALSWDVIVIPGYLMLNLAVPAYVLFRRYQGREVPERRLLPVALLTILWAVALHTVTAFLFVSAVGRPFWHHALLVPRFLASAFACGPALLLLVLSIMEWRKLIELDASLLRLLAIITGAALQANLIMLGAEAFTDLYSPTEHSASAIYLFLGQYGDTSLTHWMRLAVIFELAAMALIMVEKLRAFRPALWVACGLAVVGVWIDKGLAFVVPGFVPGPLGDVTRYDPTIIEVLVSLGIWALGAVVFIVLAKVALSIEHRPVTTRA